MDDDENKIICQICGKRQATVHLTEFVEGEPVQTHFCEACYSETEGLPPLTPAAVFSHILSAVAPELKKLTGRRCPHCGMDYLTFRQQGLLGCPNDYELFKDALSQLLEQIHASTEHCGKVPPQAGRQAALHSRARSLRRQMEKAVLTENYELAAQLRDEIQGIESGQDEPDTSKR
ncbi:MAG: UvrB/UvrC motif-containing protein [Planctomycetes bacterium]|nr:UvrB/UvrC motif-containing protein [Planctomycetota bacterium]